MFCAQGTRSVRSHLDFLVRFNLAALLAAVFFVSGCGNSAPSAEPDANLPTAKSDPEPTGFIVKKPLTSGLTTKTVVLTYHDMVLRRDQNSVWFDCTPEELLEQLDALAESGANFISLEDLYHGLTGTKPLKPQSVVITFADNYQGFFDHAWPILKKRGIPTTLFVHTGHVGSQKGRPKMSWQTLSELMDSGLVSVQSQTVSHPADITKLGASSVAKELSISKTDIESQLNSQCWAIAYPNGKFDLATAAAAEKAGYLIGFTEEQSPAESAPDIYRVPRWVHTKWKEAWQMAQKTNKN